MADLSVPAIAALGASGAILIGAFFAGVVSVITAWRTIAAKVVAIESHVNSEKTAAEGREKTLRSENMLLREMLNDRKQTAALLAQAASHPLAATAAATTVAAAEATAAATAKTVEVLDKIETNTAATADGVLGLKTP